MFPNFFARLVVRVCLPWLATPFLSFCCRGLRHCNLAKSKNEMIASISFHPQKFGPEEIAREKEKLKEYFLAGEGKEANLKGLYFWASAHSQGSFHAIFRTYIKPLSQVMKNALSLSADDIFWEVSHGKHTRSHRTLKIFGLQYFSHVRWHMLTITMLPERVTVNIHYLAHNRLYVCTYVVRQKNEIW